jgi:hypothetical protein
MKNQVIPAFNPRPSTASLSFWKGLTDKPINPEVPGKTIVRPVAESGISIRASGVAGGAMVLNAAKAF